VFQIAAVPFDDFDTLDVPDGPRWLLVRLARYADREGRCFPSMRTLAAGARKSLATVCRWLRQLCEAGCFTRTRKAGRVYHYTLAEPYRLRWREQPKPAAGQGVSPPQGGVSQRAKQEAASSKHEESAREEMKWRAALRRFFEHGQWVTRHGPPPGQPGCLAPSHLLAQWLPVNEPAQRRWLMTTG
jgi:hypothetical protein